MNKQYPFVKKHQLNNDDDEQVEKTLNFFDSILNQYLTDQDRIDHNNIQKSSLPIKLTNNVSTQQNGTTSKHTTTSTSSSSSSSSAGYIPVPQTRHRFESTHHIRHYTSVNNLNEIPSSSSKPKSSHSRTLQTTATSTDDLITNSSEKHRSNFIKIANNLLLNGESASLIDLSSIDKLSSRPRFRFVPLLNENHLLKEESEIQQQFQLKTISSDQKSFNNQIKLSHKIVKPTVIIPPVPKSAPINRLTETNIHHQNGNSAFKPHQPNKKNNISSKTEPIKRTESIHKPNTHVGITNANNQVSDNDLLLHQQQSIPQVHQSSLNVSSPEPVNTNRLPPRVSYQPKPVQSNKSNGYHPFRSAILQEPISRWNQHINNTSNMIGLVHSGANRLQHQTYPHSSHTSTNPGISSTVNNHRQQTYYNPTNIRKYHTSQHPLPIQSIYPNSPPVTRNNIYPSPSTNIYNFNQNNSSRDRQSRRHPYRQNVTTTTYL